MLIADAILSYEEFASRWYAWRDAAAREQYPFEVHLESALYKKYNPGMYSGH